MKTEKRSLQGSIILLLPPLRGGGGGKKTKTENREGN